MHFPSMASGKAWLILCDDLVPAGPEHNQLQPPPQAMNGRKHENVCGSEGAAGQQVGRQVVGRRVERPQSGTAYHVCGGGYMRFQNPTGGSELMRVSCACSEVF